MINLGARQSDNRQMDQDSYFGPPGLVPGGPSSGAVPSAGLAPGSARPPGWRPPLPPGASSGLPAPTAGRGLSLKWVAGAVGVVALAGGYLLFSGSGTHESKSMDPGAAARIDAALIGKYIAGYYAADHSD